MKILLAVDGSDYTRKMLDYVCDNRSLFDASHEYVAFTAPMPVPPHARSVVGSATVQGFHEEEAQKVLGPTLERMRSAGLQARGEWKPGSAGETIAAVSREGGYDMIIMGSHGHGALARLVMGSVTTIVLAECTVPVLLIR
ncbi:MAG: universal stress protein [Burkholderiales bacterium]|nr:universal stress protein [Burkholderiales bacterium]